MFASRVSNGRNRELLLANSETLWTQTVELYRRNEARAGHPHLSSVFVTAWDDDENDYYDGDDDNDYDEGLYFLHPAVCIVVKVLQWLSAQQLMNTTDTKIATVLFYYVYPLHILI
jgi:hypothetical protein